MTTEIRIDPNVRVEGNMTYAGYEDLLNVTEPPKVGEVVLVRETESDIVGWATVARVDPLTKLIYLSLDWAALRLETLSPLVLTENFDNAAQYFATWTVAQPAELFRTNLSSSVAVAAQQLLESSSSSSSRAV